MQDVKLPGWLNRLLGDRIIPALRRLGFDEQLAWAFFKMAAPAWKSMGPITDENGDAKNSKIYPKVSIKAPRFLTPNSWKQSAAIYIVELKYPINIMGQPSE